MTDVISRLRKIAEGKLRLVFVLIAGVAAVGTAHAVTSQSFQVSATIVPGCSVTTGTGGVLGTLNFGTRSGVATGQVSTSFVPNGSLSIACTPNVALSMSIDGGQHYSSVRRMQRASGTEMVAYRLYSSSSLAANSEIGVNQAVPVTYTNSNNIALPLFGVALLTGFSPAGTYSDQLTVTLSW
ncbi:spore coat U domain-containing protein [Lelliottia sp. V106_10]|uniref:Csu type fimbrial protein n=1 Tax=Lelliottia wanjuensis TaxID=3050585 RepID=UPI00254CA7AB|nr:MULTISPECIES: spore coat U domain-containing protein [unclassified Lelliottia]MDK9356827.1 spore coat U domain-containing protein [Lelliottia sp. V106_16]MDK9372501.1 spore coat U domain-containing protein [Lelliottia sp. V106_10]MDK9599305.1 spore coat U domain-containing protein [Lelliottia sp. V106_5]